ncbi:sulfite reductase flavo protein alpha-component [Myriangium duriaei CBS 260.36]|uniref:NADPH-dependent diflavin oxidoreductase 1 n=1 Tax=Myriangium duriaei CBS 260.36 TaxID=1168546 RepID=A0A9P4MI66_9PEZI|nr:sulfite reductase flavo protein alpha-component [Myriangium duriaei CBS 260.36]
MPADATAENTTAHPNGHRDVSTKRRSALVLYGSETGNAQDVAEEIGRLTARLHFETIILDLDSIDIRDLVKHTIVVIAISTTGQGEFPQNARAFWKTLLSNRLRSGVLRRMNFSTFGLGDSSYPQYNVVHRMLHGRLLQLGAQLFCQRGEGNEQHPEGHSADLRTWILDLRDSLEKHFPLPEYQKIIPDDTFIEPKWRLQLQANTDAPYGGSKDIRVDGNPDRSLVAIRDSIQAELITNERLTPSDHFQDVRLMDLSLDADIPYGPGAVAVVYPKNFPADVEAFIRTQSWESVADKPIELVPTDNNTSLLSPSPLRHVSLPTTTTLRLLLTNHLDILSIPRRSFFSSLAYFTKSGNEDEQYQRERILELANPELIDELWDYTTRPRRTILEVMPDFPSIKIPWQYACTVLPVMRGRQFSIASGGALRTTAIPSHEAVGSAVRERTRVQLLVAIANPPNPIIKYRKRHGVCTRYIATLEAGQTLNLGMQPGYLNVKPEDYEVPMIMISPGTGLAPMRSLIYDRLQCAEGSATDSSARPLDGCLLFFGCRNRDADYFFGHEWDSLENKGLRTFLALSRDKNAPRNYVQDLIVKEADSVFEAIDERHGKIFVCGSSGNMPKGVRQALVDVIKSKQGSGEEEAEAYLAALEKQGRYKQETW